MFVSKKCCRRCKSILYESVRSAADKVFVKLKCQIKMELI